MRDDTAGCNCELGKCFRATVVVSEQQPAGGVNRKEFFNFYLIAKNVAGKKYKYWPRKAIDFQAAFQK